MKKKLLSLLLALCLVMALVPMTAFAEENEQNNKTTITTVDELLQFAKAVDNGDRDFIVLLVFFCKCCHRDKRHHKTQRKQKA